MVEEWRPIPGWQGLYEASSFGRIRSLDRMCRTRPGRSLYLKKGIVLKRLRNSRGYPMVGLRERGARKLASQTVHRLIALTFLGPPVGDKTTVNHKDGDKWNNLPDNLEWLSNADNLRHAWATGLKKNGGGAEAGNSKLTECQVREIRKRYAAKQDSQKALAREFGVVSSTIWFIVNGKTWTQLAS